MVLSRARAIPSSLLTAAPPQRKPSIAWRPRRAEELAAGNFPALCRTWPRRCGTSPPADLAGRKRSSWPRMLPRGDCPGQGAGPGLAPGGGWGHGIIKGRKRARIRMARAGVRRRLCGLISRRAGAAGGIGAGQETGSVNRFVNRTGRDAVRWWRHARSRETCGRRFAEARAVTRDSARRRRRMSFVS
jgi:hypothetical protein